MNDVLRRKWQELLRSWAVATPLAEQAFVEVCRRYTEPGRFYHTLEHVQNVLETVEDLGSYAQNPSAVKLAAWLHDVIYDSRARDNEERSADFAVSLCATLAIPEGRLVADLIGKTKTHDAGADADARVLLDADLAILGAGEGVYRDYAAKIRQEYAWVADSAYRMGRRKVLESFLARPRIFHFLGHLEKPARHNITAEIACLADVGASGIKPQEERTR